MIIKSLGTAAKLVEGSIGTVTLVGSDGKLASSQSAESLTIEAPHHVPNEITFRITPHK